MVVSSYGLQKIGMYIDTYECSSLILKYHSCFRSRVKYLSYLNSEILHSLATSLCIL